MAREYCYASKYCYANVPDGCEIEMHIWLRVNCFDLCKSSYFTCMKKTFFRTVKVIVLDISLALIRVDNVVVFWFFIIQVTGCTFDTVYYFQYASY